MDKAMIEGYIRYRMKELERCLDNPRVYNQTACQARWNELNDLLKAIGIKEAA